MPSEALTANKIQGDGNLRRIMGQDGKMYFSVVDVLMRLRESDYESARRYWKDINSGSLTPDYMRTA